jgi:hypothetical protein
MTVADKPRGLLMKVAPDTQIDADDFFLRALIDASKMLAAHDIVLKYLGAPGDKVKDAESKLRNLKDAIRLNDPKVSAGDLAGIKSLADAEKWLQGWFKDKTEVFTPEGEKRTISPGRFLELLKKRNEVCDQRLARLEIRACNLGKNLDALSTVAEFFGVQEATAPLVSTIFGEVNPHLYDQRHFNLWVKKVAPSLGGGVDPVAGRRVLDTRGPKGWNGVPGGNVTSALALWGDSQDMVAHDKEGERDFVKTFIMANTVYMGGAFPLMGFDCARRGAAPPAEANGKSFVLPAEPEYRAIIKSALPPVKVLPPMVGLF